ncbi:hypothetical protein [uncultured Maritimibacter sp.]|jgi:hypothetical protein|uniref:hypothetical protein n=1 Tax=uncultured Maritimibacter sp. TaxID=991866 RepID=UPI00260498D9|nr:hypothetical protein [uncultured Maritimibacter sp.]
MTGRARQGSGDPWQAEINRTFGLRFNITGDAPDRREAVANRVDWHRRTRTAHLAKLVFAAHRTAQLGGKARGSSDPVLVSHLTEGTCRVEQAGRKDRATAGDL